MRLRLVALVARHGEGLPVGLNRSVWGQAERQTKLEELKEHEEELQRPQPRVHHGIVNGCEWAHRGSFIITIHDIT
jgi:hypothetical protein